MPADEPHEQSAPRIRTESPISPEELEQLQLADVPESADSLRERKKLETRRKLTWAAIGLALRRGGLEDVRTEEIAEVAGVSPRTFNNYFRSREEAIGAMAGDRARRVALALADRPAGEPLAQALAEAVVTEYTLGQEPDKGAMFQLRQLMITNCEVRPHMLNAMTRLEDELTPVLAERLGLPADDLFPRVLAAAVNGAIRVATEYWLRDDHGAPYTALLRQTVTTVAGLAEHIPPASSGSRPGPSLPENANP